MHIRNHCVRRYCERVLGYELSGDFDRAMASFERHSGLTIADIRSRIIADVRPGIPATVLFRGTRKVVRGIHARYVVNQGSVHTCYRGDEFDDE